MTLNKTQLKSCRNLFIHSIHLLLVENLSIETRNVGSRGATNSITQMFRGACAFDIFRLDILIFDQKYVSHSFLPRYQIGSIMNLRGILKIKEWVVFYINRFPRTLSIAFRCRASFASLTSNERIMIPFQLLFHYKEHAEPVSAQDRPKTVIFTILTCF